MKRLLTTLFAAVFSVAFLFAQTGVTGHGSADQTNINKLKSIITIYNSTVDWQALETNENVWNWATLDAQGNVCKANNLKFEFMVYTGASAPAYLYQKGVPMVITNEQVDKYPHYPYYFNAYYKTRFKNMLTQVINHVRSSSYNDIVFQWWVAEGVTGDDFAWKGDPLNPAYNITQSQWDAWKHEVWLYVDSLLAIDPQHNIRIGVNSGNDGEHFAWAAQHLYEPAFKLGNFGHNIFFPGDYYSTIRLNSLDTTASHYKNISRSEFQQIYKSAFWKHYPKAMTWMVTINALTGGLKQFNLTAANLTENTSDLSIYNEFNEFAAYRRPQDADRALIVLGNPINLTDSVLYSPITYGKLIADADYAEYHTKYLNQVTNNTTDSSDKIISNAVGLMVDYFNPARASAIVALYPGATYTGIQQGNDNDTWANDANIYGKTNYEKFIHMSNYQQSKLLVKVGMNVDSKFGRWARTFDDANDPLLFDINDNVDLSGGITVEVTYLDSSTGSWRLDYRDNRLGHSRRVVCTNTMQWLTTTFTIPNFTPNGLLTDDDIALEYVRGAKTVFQMIKVKRIASLN
jgi:hypothetical protein